MSATKKLLAFDLGAESGRGLLGRFDGERLQLEVVHRFPNGGVALLDRLYWNSLGLYGEMLNTLRRCAADHGPIDGLGVDTWGVDFALLGRDGELLGNPRHYRDPHTEGTIEQACKIVSREQLFARTGLQFMRFNSLFQLLAMQRDRSPLLDIAESLLFVPDLFHYWMTGIRANEFTIASTSQLIDPRSRGWAFDLVGAFDLPARLFGTIVPPGTVLGPLRPSVASETGSNPAPVIAPAAHDTGSAVAAVPSQGGSWVFISSGTWSLMGAELAEPLVNSEVGRYNFTNEGGVGGTTRFLKNIMGLWLVQECRRAWERAGVSYAYDALTRLAADAPAFVSLINPDDPSFLLPASMPVAIAEFCRKSAQPAPQEPGPVVRCALESLALRYRWVLARLEELVGRRFDVIHVVGGGGQNELLCQFTADACNRPVHAGPVEATAVGNLLVQALGLGLLGSLDDVRAVVRRSFEVKVFEPGETRPWDEAYSRFEKLLV